MGKWSEYIGAQFGAPRGFVGKCCCFVMNRMNRAMYGAVVRALDAPARVLDIGYGNGYLIGLLCARFPAVQVDGIDISDDMRQAALARNHRAAAAGRVRLLTGDCCALPYADGAFDAVTSVNTVYFWEDTLAGLREIHRVLQAGGVFYNAVYSKDWLEKLSYTQKGFQLFSCEALVALGRQAGFSSVTVSDIAKGKSHLITYHK